MSLLNYRVHNTISDHKDFFDKLHAWVVDQGWTINVLQEDKQWASIGGGQYGWVAGSEDFMEVRSSGYGSQAMQFRLRQNATGTNNNRWLEIGGFYGTQGYDTASSVHPVTRVSSSVSNWNSTSRYFGVSSETMPTLWLFGNSKIIIGVVKYTGTYIQTFAFGSIEVINQSEQQCYFVGATSTSTNYWYSFNTACPFDEYSNRFYHNGSGLAADTAVKPSFIASTGTAITDKSFLSYGAQSLVRNSISTKRPMFKQDIYIKDSSDSLWFNAGTHHAYRIRNNDLLIGEEIQYGSERYLVFPYNNFGTTNIGFAIRIA